MNEDIRWKQRFQNFQRTYTLLRLPFEPGTPFSLLEKEGVIQHFEYTFELAWKTIKDYLENGGIVLNPVTAREVIKEAFAARVIADGQVWIDMLDHRNLLSHTYDRAVFETAVDAIAQRYLPAINQVHDFLQSESLK